MTSFKKLNCEHGPLFDHFKQEFKQGSKVVWVGGKGRYAGVSVWTVIGRTKLKLYIERKHETKLIDWGDLVIVDKLIAETEA